jgi:hypothetical protein
LHENWEGITQLLGLGMHSLGENFTIIESLYNKMRQPMSQSIKIS